jgi:hypothetical protein
MEGGVSATFAVAERSLASYLRPGRNDHTVLQQLLSENQLSATGLVIDPALISRQADVAHEAGRQGIETVLDSRSLDLSTEAGFDLSGARELPWAPPSPHGPDDLAGPAGLLLAESLASFATEHAISAVLAPTHIVSSSHDSWLDCDAALAAHLRRALDSRGRTDSPIYYPLVIRSKLLYDDEERKRLIEHLVQLPIDAVWLRVHPFGTTTSGPLALRRYIQACQDMHQVGMPIVAEHTGTVGLPLLAFGAVGGIVSGVTLGERFSLDRYTRTSDGAGFSPPPRVYISDLGALVTRDQARSFFAKRGMRAAHGCQDRRCCPHGWEDSVANPRRHFIVQRGTEVGRLSRTPPELRPSVYLNEFLRPASEAAVRAALAEAAFKPVSHRLDSWRATLEALLSAGPPQTYSAAPSGTRVHAGGA